MQSHWPSGLSGNIHIDGSARDLWTGGNDRAAHVVDQQRITFILTPDKRIADATADRHQSALASFAGLRPGGQLRKAATAHLPGEVAGGTLFYRLIDELGGASFMAGSAWFSWLPGGFEEYEAATGAPTQLHRSVEGVCITFQPGSAAMTADGRTNHVISSHPDAPLPFRNDDPAAWHDFADVAGANHWRIRYTDIWLENGKIRVRAGFQDSSALRDRTDRRLLFHEYLIDATVDPDGLILKDIAVQPGSLPFSTCLAAPATAAALTGRPIGAFGELAPALLAGTAGCTHLNEMLRSLRDVPAMAAILNDRNSSKET